MKTLVVPAISKVSGFHQGILKIAMEPSILGSVLMQGGPQRHIKLDQSPGVDEVSVWCTSQCCIPCS